MSLPVIQSQAQLDLNLAGDLQGTNFSQFDQALPTLKDIHSNYQTQIVHDLTKISVETDKIITNLTDIEKQIVDYQNDIEQWANKINTITTQSESINTTFASFERKVTNYEKLNKELKSRIKK